MKGAILEKGQTYYTQLRPIFESLDNAQLNYNWLITDFQGIPNNPDYDRMLNQDYCWLSGEQLTEMVREEDFQWIWATLSGFNKEIGMKQVLAYPLPFAEENQGFWQNPISIQHPLAEIEIVPFDSTLVLVISRSDMLVENFMRAYPLARDLSEYNESLK